MVSPRAVPASLPYRGPHQHRLLDARTIGRQVRMGDIEICGVNTVSVYGLGCVLGEATRFPAFRR